MTSDAKHVTYTASGGNVVHTVSNYQELESIAAVSYTHLTLPTNREV